ncbi:MAG: LssY C-terminal domain-containing protein [Yoonia sp.]|nr:LssY C-terminal domain-containing protein [Yoonia sp.]
MHAYYNDLLPSIQSLGLWGYWLVGLLAFGEALVLTSIFAPGTVVVVLGGALVAQGFYDFGDMVWFVAIGTVLGAEASFRIGAKGTILFQKGRRVFSPAHLERGKQFFAKYGAPSIVMGHFFGPLRPVMPVVAGLSGMSRRRFFLWNVTGGFCYAVILVSVGYFFGTAADAFSATMTRAGLFALAVLLTIAVGWFVTVKLRKTLPFFASVLRSVGGAIRDNLDVHALVARHPILFSVLSDRLSRDAVTGLPATIVASTSVYFLLLYAGSTLDFVTQSRFVAADVRVANLLSAFRDPDLVRFFTVVSAIGYWKVIATLGIAASALMVLRRRPQYLAGLWLTVIGNQLTVTLLKNIFARPRPEMAVYVESSFSFPSGHSAASVAFFGFVTYVVIREHIGWVVTSFVTGASLIFLIGLSRIYLVEHYLSDVLNGYLVGALWMLLGIFLAQWLTTRADWTVQTTVQPWQKVASIGVVISAVVTAAVIVKDYQQTYNRRPIHDIIQLDAPLQTAFAGGHLPTHSENILGQPQEPISLVVLAQNDAAFTTAFNKAGWHVADWPGFNAMSPAFWDSRPNDVGYQTGPGQDSLEYRHHARFWRTDFRTQDGLLIFVGTASRDQGLKWGLTHQIDPNIDAERDFLATGLRNTGLISAEYRFQLVAPVLAQTVTDDPFFTDGKAIVLQIRPEAAQQPSGQP